MKALHKITTPVCSIKLKLQLRLTILILGDGTSLTALQCEHCGKYFATERNLKRHIWCNHKGLIILNRIKHSRWK